MPDRYLHIRRQFDALALGPIGGALFGVIVGAVRTWALGDSALPTTGGHRGLPTLLLGVFSLIAYGGTFLLGFLNTSVVCAALVLLASLLHDVARSSWIGPKGLSALLMLAVAVTTWMWMGSRLFAHEELAALVNLLRPATVAISALLAGTTALVLLRSLQKRGFFLPVNRIPTDRHA